jgi:heme/copper-type cytochrome/quinol oxidase subunit 2
MMHFTVIHWIVIVVFILIFILLAVLAQKELNKRTRISLIILSFLISLIGAIVSFLILDKYTKKAKIINHSTQRNYNKESVTIRGKIKNIGKFYIAYCTMDIKIVNKVVYKKRKNFMYKTSSIGDMFKSRGYKKNYLKTSVKAVEDLKPRLSKNFSVSIKIPSYFQNPRYFLHLVCH